MSEVPLYLAHKKSFHSNGRISNGKNFRVEGDSGLRGRIVSELPPSKGFIWKFPEKKIRFSRSPTLVTRNWGHTIEEHTADYESWICINKGPKSERIPLGMGCVYVELLHPHGGVRPFHRKCLTQLNLEPHVVQDPIMFVILDSSKVRICVSKEPFP